MPTKTKELLKNIEEFIILAAVVLFPVFTLSLTSAPAFIPRVMLLSGALLLIMSVWAVRAALSGRISFSAGRFDLGVLLIVIVYAVSTFFKVQNKSEALFFPGTALLMIVPAFFYFIINQYSSKIKGSLVWALALSSLLLALSVLAVEIGLFAKIPQLPAFVKDPNFNAFGGMLPSIILIATAIPLFAKLVIREKDWSKRMFAAVSFIISGIALGIMIYRILPGKPQAFKIIGFKNSWEISMDAIKNSPLLGSGPGNYLTAFNLYKPVSYNTGSLWNLKFSTARDFYLTLITETGLGGLFAFGVLLAGIIIYLSKSLGDGIRRADFFESLSLLTFIAAFAAFPASIHLMFPFFITLGILSGSENEPKEAETAVKSKVPAYFIAALILALAAAGAVVGVKTVSAETKYKKSLDALTANKAKETYDLMRQAVFSSPKSDRYHMSFAQVNMLLARSIAQKENLSDEDKKAVSQFIQQAISEGKAAVALNPQKAENWEILAGIYRSIMPFAQGADNFTVQTYLQAVALDPVNPDLRIALGGTYYALGRYDEAIETFKLAVLTKPDLANAHYNLAMAYKEKKDYDNAISQMNIVLSLIKEGSSDYQLAKTELENLEKSRPSKETEATENLTPPEKAEEPLISPPLNLPDDATPPGTNQPGI